MPTASYYREQARLLMRWGQLARDSAVAEQLTNRAQQMLEMAEQRDEQCNERLPLDWTRSQGVAP